MSYICCLPSPIKRFYQSAQYRTDGDPKHQCKRIERQWQDPLLCREEDIRRNTISSILDSAAKSTRKDTRDYERRIVLCHALWDDEDEEQDKGSLVSLASESLSGGAIGHTVYPIRKPKVSIIGNVASGTTAAVKFHEVTAKKLNSKKLLSTLNSADRLSAGVVNEVALIPTRIVTQ